MSIFTGGYDPSVWLRQKSLMSLQMTAELVDIANQPDTTTWYAKNLKRIAKSLLSVLVPMTALFHSTGQESVHHSEWLSIAEQGTFALTKWCRKWGVANPYHFADSLTAKSQEGAEFEEKQQSVVPAVDTADDSAVRGHRLHIFGYMSLRMLDDSLGRPARRLLAWALHHLELSDFADIVILNKTFLPTDIGCTREETAEGYRQLYQRGLIEKVETLQIRKEAIAIRLVVEGINDSKHAPAFQEESFGAKGLRIGGQPTTGNTIPILLDQSQRKYLQWLRAQPEKTLQLQEHIQAAIGEDRVYVEDVQLSPHGREPSQVTLDVVVRYPMSMDDKTVEQEVEAIARQWIMQSRVVK